MNKNLAIAVLLIFAVLLLSAGFAAYSHYSRELTAARAKANNLERRATSLEVEANDLREKLRDAHGRIDEATVLKRMNADLEAQVAALKPAQPPAPPPQIDVDALPRFGGGGGGPFGGGGRREIVRAYMDMIARNEQKVADLARDPQAALKLRKLDDLPADERKAELARMQQAGDAITIDNEIIALGTPGLDDRLRRLIMEQGGGRRFGGGGGGRRYEPPKEPETNNDKF